MSLFSLKTNFYLLLQICFIAAAFAWKTTTLQEKIASWHSTSLNRSFAADSSSEFGIDSSRIYYMTGIRYTRNRINDQPRRAGDCMSRSQNRVNGQQDPTERVKPGGLCMYNLSCSQPLRFDYHKARMCGKQSESEWSTTSLIRFLRIRCAST